jgi:hypothetical protein
MGFECRIKSNLLSIQHSKLKIQNYRHASSNARKKTAEDAAANRRPARACDCPDDGLARL